MTDSVTQSQIHSRQVALLRSIGEKLYGPRWQTDLSAAISVSDRSMRRWVSGQDPVPYGAWNDLRLLVQTRWIDLREIEYQINDLQTVTVYRFMAWNGTKGISERSPIRATLAYIKKVGADVVAGSERRVDAWDVDVEGRYIRDDAEAKTSVSDVMQSSNGYGFNLLNQHRAPLATFEYENRETALRMRRLFHEVHGNAVHVAVNNR